MPTVREIVAERLRNGEDPADIAAERGCNTTYIYKVAQDAGIKLPKKRRGPKGDTDRKMQGKLQAQIGGALFNYRGNVEMLNWAELGEKLGMSGTNVMNAESGMYDFKLSELERISAFLNIPLEELVKRRTTSFAPPPTIAKPKETIS